jgi:hypothetical protein
MSRKSPPTAAADDPGADRLRLYDGLSLPRPAARHAAASDRHRPLQIRRVQAEREHQVWGIDKQLQEDGARPIIARTRAATCMQPQVKGLTIMVNSQYNGCRMEDVWLDG